MVVDVMSKLRQMSFVKNDSFGNFLKSCLNSTLNISEQIECLHLVQDSYIEQSLKECERMKRSDGTHGLEIIDMSSETPVPVVPEKFWSSEENKRKIQLLFCDIVRDEVYRNQTIITSSVIIDGEVKSARYSSGEEIPELMNYIEEADSKIIVHLEWAIRIKHCARVIVLSNDTDVFTLLLHYTSHLKELGLKELWQQYGTGEKGA